MKVLIKYSFKIILFDFVLWLEVEGEFHIIVTKCTVRKGCVMPLQL